MRQAALPFLLASALALLPGIARAQFGPQGSQFQVNTYTTNRQFYPSLAADPSGNFVVVWETESGNGTDTGYSIQGQRYNASATPIGSQFQLNTYTTGKQLFPVVAMDTVGNFVVAWESDAGSGTDTGYSIQGQRFNASATPQGSQFQVNTYTTSRQLLPAVAMNGSGAFVVAWQSDGSSSGDTFGYSVQAQRFNASATPQGGQFQVNTYTTDLQRTASVAMDSSGAFVVTWHSAGGSGTDTDNASVHAQRYNASGTPQGSEFQVNTYTTNYQLNSRVVMDASGNFVVAWVSAGSATDSSSTSVQMQRYNASATPIGSQFQVNTYTSGSQYQPSMFFDASGNFVVAWSSYGSSGTDTSSDSIQMQRYNASATPIGTQFQVNTYTSNYQLEPLVAGDTSGNFVVAWYSSGSSGTDSSLYSIQGQRFGGAPVNTATSTPSATLTATATAVPPTSTATATAVPPTATATATTVPPTSTATATAVPPTSTATATAVPPTSTSTATATAVPPTSTSTATATAVPPTSTATATASGSSAHLVISQVYGGGGNNSSSTFKNDFIELFNGTGATVDLSNWSVQYSNATASLWSVTALSGSLPTGRYYLVKEASQGVFGTPLPVAPDATGSINVFHLNGKVALVNTTTALSGACPSNPNIIDLVGYGPSASCFEGSAPTSPDASVSSSVGRLGGVSGGCTDTDQNSSDLIVQAASTTGPRNSSSAGNGCGGPNPTAIPSPTFTPPPADTPTPTNPPINTPTPTNPPINTATPTTTPTSPPTATSTSTPTSTPINTAFPTLSPTPSPASSGASILISQVYGGGGNNSSSTYHNDFIELFNATSSPISLSGLSVQYANATASLWLVTALSGSIPAHGYYLVKEANQGVFGLALPPADASGSINIYHLNGKVALVSGTTALTGACPSGGNILDFVGFGPSANCFEGSAPVSPDASLTTSVFRLGGSSGGCTDTNRNSLDLQVQGVSAPGPRNSSSPLNFCSGPRPGEQLDAPSWGGMQLLALLALGVLGLLARRWRSRTA